jgi:hypothetical protein
MMALAPGGERRAEVVQPWEIEAEPPQITGNQRICIECAGVCPPEFGAGLPGRGGRRLRCFRCSPSIHTRKHRSR